MLQYFSFQNYFSKEREENSFKEIIKIMVEENGTLMQEVSII